MYKIKWVSKFTDAEGIGVKSYTKEQAENIAQAMNDEKDAKCNHCIVPANDTESK